MNLVWRKNATVLKSRTVSNSLVIPVTFPATMGTPEIISLSTSAIEDNTLATLVNVRLYLEGDAAQLDTLLNVWPNYGAATSTSKQHSDLSGGIELSFDLGSSFLRLGTLPDGTRRGLADDSTTWLTLPRSTVVPGSFNGSLGPIDIATLAIRYIVPPMADQYQIFNVRLEAAFDVV